MFRVDGTGQPDTGFGSNGRLRTGIGDDVDEAYALVLQPDGKAVAAGLSITSNGGTTRIVDVALARYDLGPFGVPRADLAMSQTVSAYTVPVGTNVTFTATVTNRGPEQLSFTVRDRLPGALTFDRRAMGDTPAPWER